jgi:hypothetical protein
MTAIWSMAEDAKRWVTVDIPKHARLLLEVLGKE